MKYAQFQTLVDLVLKHNKNVTPASILMRISKVLNINFMEVSKMRKIVRDADLHKKYNLQRPTLVYIIK